MENLRIVQRKNGELWENIYFQHLKKGDIFRMFEPTGDPVIGNKNDTEFVADSDVYKNTNDIWQIDVI